MGDKLGLTIILMLFSSSVIFAQHLSSARGISIAASTATIQDVSAIDWNPAALVEVPDIEIDITSNLSRQSRGLSLLSLSGAKKVLNHHVFSTAYTPGKEINFAIPSMLTILDSAGNLVTAKYDREISYRQVLSGGYSFSPDASLSIGTAVRLFESDVSDAKYYIDSLNTIASRIEKNNISIWSVDLGGIFKYNDKVKIGGVIKNLIYGNVGTLPPDLDSYKLRLQRVARIGAGLQAVENFLIGLEADTESDIRGGVEWTPTGTFSVRSGFYSSFSSPIKLEAIAVGGGIKLDRFSADIGYLWFPSLSNREGYINLATFSNTSFTDLDYTPFTPSQFVISLKANMGYEHKTLAMIEDVKIMNEIYPASSKVYSFTPIGSALIKNKAGKRISAKVSFYIPEVMNLPTETVPYVIESDEVAEIPFHAVFNSKIDSIKALSVYEGTVYVKAEVATDYDDKYQMRVFVRGRNEWNGDVNSLHFFVTPGDDKVVEFSRKILHQEKSHLDTTASILLPFEKARVIFDALTYTLQYVSDPRLSRDFVQYPSETLTLHSGDCDDITVCYASLLMSVGISTAFVNVLPQDSTENAHIYLMFDTGIPTEKANHLTANSKRYCIRRNDKNIETVWIPIETTMLKSGFTHAWDVGADQFYREADIGSGILKGWIQIIDVTGRE